MSSLVPVPDGPFEEQFYKYAVAEVSVVDDICAFCETRETYDHGPRHIHWCLPCHPLNQLRHLEEGRIMSVGFWSLCKKLGINYQRRLTLAMMYDAWQHDDRYKIYPMQYEMDV